VGLSPRALDLVLVVAGSLAMAGLSHAVIRLPFTPVPVTGQTLGVLLVGSSLGAARGGAAMTLYLLYGVAGLPVYAEGASGVQSLLIGSATGGYLWGFLVAAIVVGYLAQRGWDRTIGSSIGAMLVGEVIVFTFGVSWLAASLGIPAEKAMTLGLYPFVLGDLVKLLVAAGILPGAWRLIGRR
jgi:biotin transport system substrate-specific component